MRDSRRKLLIEKNKYEQKISELHKELEEAAGLLSQKKSELSGLLSEKGRAEKEIKALETRKIELQGKIETLNETIKAKEVHVRETVENESDVILSMEDQRKAKEYELREITKKINIKKEKLAKLKDVTKEIKEAEKKLKALNSRRERLESYNTKLGIKLDKRESDLDKREKDINEKIKRHSRILVETEKENRTLEHYVKRLQRIYDNRGIKINLLKQFNIKGDNT